jgi:hypothetical protein
MANASEQTSSNGQPQQNSSANRQSEEASGAERSEDVQEVEVTEEIEGDVALQGNAPSPLGDVASTVETSASFRPVSRTERRNLWLKEYGDQDFALQMWARLVEQQDLEIEMMLQMHGMLVFGVMVSTLRYAQFYIDLNEELHRENEPETADALREYYTALVPPHDQPEIGPEGLPVLSRYIHMRDVTIMSGGHRIKVPYWRGKLTEVDGFVVGATPGE